VTEVLREGVAKAEASASAAATGIDLLLGFIVSSPLLNIYSISDSSILILFEMNSQFVHSGVLGN
jgi:hypothetical protein